MLVPDFVVRVDLLPFEVQVGIFGFIVHLRRVYYFVGFERDHYLEEGVLRFRRGELDSALEVFGCLVNNLEGLESLRIEGGSVVVKIVDVEVLKHLET